MSRQIFFVDKKKKLQGPFSERTVQEWYRAGWFDRAFRFSFLAKSEQHNNKTPTYSLNALISSNGHGCPFLGAPRASRANKFSRVEREQLRKLERLEKEIVDARSAVDSILKLQQRLEKAEQQLKELTETPPPTSSPQSSPRLPPSPPISPPTVSQSTPSPATGVPKRIREECEELAARVASSVLHAMELLQSGETTRWDHQRARKLLERVNIFIAAHERVEAVLHLAKSLTIEKLLRGFEGRDFAICSLCHTIALNPRQALIHLLTPDHSATLEKNGLRTLIIASEVLVKVAPCTFRWGDEDHATHLSQLVMDELGRPRPNHLAVYNSLVPTRVFLAEMQLKHGLPVTIRAVTDNGGRIPTILQTLPLAFQTFKGSAGAAVIADLDAHMKDGVTGCIDCGVVTRTREAYYKHVVGWMHMHKSVETFAMNVVSVAVNCHMKHLVKTEI